MFRILPPQPAHMRVDSAERIRTCKHQLVSLTKCFAHQQNLAALPGYSKSGRESPSASSNPLSPASQSGLHRPTCEDPSKPRGTAEFCGSRLVSVSGIWPEKRHSSAWSQRSFFGVSFLLDPLIGAGDIEERAFYRDNAIRPLVWLG